MILSLVRWVFGSAIVVSIVHYTDNVVRFSHYSVHDPSPAFAWITAPVVAIAWFVLTGFGIWGYRELVVGRTSRAAIGFGVYSLSGLIGLAHFVDLPAAEMDAFQLTFILLDVALGIAMLLISIALAFGTRPRGVPAAAR